MLACQLLTRHHTLHCTYDFGRFVSDLSAQCSTYLLHSTRGGKGARGAPFPLRRDAIAESGGSCQLYL